MNLIFFLYCNEKEAQVWQPCLVPSDVSGMDSVTSTLCEKEITVISVFLLPDWPMFWPIKCTNPYKLSPLPSLRHTTSWPQRQWKLLSQPRNVQNEKHNIWYTITQTDKCTGTVCWMNKAADILEMTTPGVQTCYLYILTWIRLLPIIVCYMKKSNGPL